MLFEWLLVILFQRTVEITLFKDSQTTILSNCLQIISFNVIFRAYFSKFQINLLEILLKALFSNTLFKQSFQNNLLQTSLSSNFFKQSPFESLQKSFEPSFQTISSQSSLESIYEIIWSFQNIHSSKTLLIILWDHWLFHF